MAILAPGSEPAAEMKKDKLAKPFGIAVLDIVERSSRPSNGKQIFSTLTELDLKGTLHSSIEDYGAIRYVDSDMT